VARTELSLDHGNYTIHALGPKYPALRDSFGSFAKYTRTTQDNKYQWGGRANFPDPATHSAYSLVRVRHATVTLGWSS
jgi:hypothetical protein